MLVNRGWVPASGDRRILPDITVGSGTREVIGRIEWLPRPGIELAAADPPPDPVAADHSARLQQAIAAAIRSAGGWIPFDRYMELALYTPGLGYYAAGARKFGDSATGGDFVTAPEISPLFASALATQVVQVFSHTPARIVEFGAGSAPS